MDRARALIRCHIVCRDAKNRPIEKRMRKRGAVQPGSREGRDHVRALEIANQIAGLADLLK